MLDSNLRTKRKIGMFRITDELIRQDFHSILPLMGQMVVVRCEHVFPYMFEYTALSDLFEEVEDGELTPSYTINISRHEGENGKPIYSFEASKV